MRDEPRTNEPEEDYDAELEEPRGILSALWFRALLGVAAMSVIAVVAIPHVLRYTRVPAPSRSAPGAPLTGSAPAPSASRPLSSTAARSPASTVASTAAPAAVSAIVAEPRSSTPVATASRPAAGVSRPKPATLVPSASRRAGDAPAPVVKRARADEAKPLAARAAAAKSVAPGAGGVAGGAAMPEMATKPTSSTRARAASYWVQVGAYRDAATARRVVERLREDGYHAIDVASARDETPAPAASPATTTSVKYEVVVSGDAPAVLADGLSAKGLATAATGSSVVVKPPLSLADAVALSKDLAADGLDVKVRRTGDAAAGAANGTGARDGLHRVRVGAYPDATAADAAARELSAKGYQGFVARDAR
jgi:DedD protein